MRRTPDRALASFFAATCFTTLMASAALAQNVSTFLASQTYVRALAFDGNGTLYIARRTPANVIVKCTPPSNTTTLVAGGFADPAAMVCDAAGNLYVADYNYGAAGGWVRKVTPGGAVSIFATLPNPVSLAIDAAGNLYVGRWDRIINKVTPAGVVSVYADMNTVSYLGVNPANNHPTAFVWEPDGTLVTAVSWGALFKIAPGGASITPFSRVMLECYGLTAGGDGFMYGSSYTHDEIWKIAPDGTGTLFAGAANSAGFVNGPALTARFHDPAGLVAGSGALYIADYSNSAVRAIGLETPTPVTKTSWGSVKAGYR